MSEGSSNTGTGSVSGPGVSAAGGDPMIGQILDGRYRVVDKLGEGGMGEVYAAEHVHIEKRVAIKLLRNEILTNDEAVKRFSQEARSASSIGHKNIIGIEDFGKLPDGRIYLAMELLDGKPLSDLIEEPQPPERLINILIQTGHGLAAAHKKGIVHRDMKPENIFVTFTPEGEDVPKLLDFGIAKVSGTDGNNHLTRTGTIFGTPFYMAPEQALGQNIDHRADVYAMGVIMYEVFCGGVPFQGESFMGILTQHITAEPKPPSVAAAACGRVIPPGIEEIIVRAMRKEPDQRYQTMDELVQALVVVYRQVAGAGMSSYMQAYSGSGVMPIAHPFGGGTPGMQQTQGMSALPPGVVAAARQSQAAAAQSAPTPQPYHPNGGPANGGPANGGPGQSGPGQSGTYQPAQGSAGTTPPYSAGYDAASESMYMPKKSRSGLWIGLLVLLLIGGGGAGAYLYLNQAKTAVAETPPVGDAAGSTAGSDTTGGATGAGAGGDNTDGTAGAQVGATDAGATGTNAIVPPDAAPSAAPPDAATAPPKVEKVYVLVNSKPQGADIIGAGGEKLGTTPANVSFPKGETFPITLKMRRYKDLEVVLDGNKKKDTFSLDRVPTNGGKGGGKDGGKDGGKGGGKGGGKDGDGTTKPPSNDPCAKDPSSIQCKCKKDPMLPVCGLQ